VEVAGRHVGTLEGVVQALSTEGGSMVDRCRVGSHIVQHTSTPVSELLAPSPQKRVLKLFQSLSYVRNPLPFVEYCSAIAYMCRVSEYLRFPNNTAIISCMIMCTLIANLEQFSVKKKFEL
jgi:hypothetical protein